VSSVSLAHANTNLFQEDHPSHPLNIVVLLDHGHNRPLKNVGTIALSYEDSDGFKQIKYYDLNKMIKRDPSEPVKLKVKFPRNTVEDYEDYLICAKVVKSQKINCKNNSRSPSTDIESIRIQIP